MSFKYYWLLRELAKLLTAFFDLFDEEDDEDRQKEADKKRLQK